MKKVLFVLAAFDKGGIEKVTLDIVNNLDPDKYDITIYTIWYGGYCQSQVKPHIKVKPFFFKRYVKGVVRLVEYLPPKLLYKLFIRGRYDVEIAAGDGECSKIISGSTKKDSKKISWIHMDVIEKGSHLKEFRKKETASKIYDKFDKIICVSKQAEKQFNKKFGFEERTSTIHNPLMVDEILQKASNKAEISFDDSVFNMISVGRLTKVKGYERLIRCCEKLEKQDKISFRMYLVGDGEIKEELECYIKQNDIKSIILLGFESNPYTYIKNSNIFVSASYSEAYPLVIGESFVLGVPVIATKNSGTVEWMEEDNSGYLVENTEEALYKGLKEILLNKSLYNELLKSANEKKNGMKEELYTWEEAFLNA